MFLLVFMIQVFMLFFTAVMPPWERSVMLNNSGIIWLEEGSKSSMRTYI